MSSQQLPASGSGRSRYLRVSCYVVGGFAAAPVVLTLIVLAVDGHPLGVLAACVGALIPFPLRGLAYLLGVHRSDRPHTIPGKSTTEPPLPPDFLVPPKFSSQALEELARWQRSQPETFGHLVDALARAFGSPAAIDRVAERSGLDRRFLSETGDATNRWANMLIFAERQNRLVALLDEALQESRNRGQRAESESSDLQAAARDYLA